METNHRNNLDGKSGEYTHESLKAKNLAYQAHVKQGFRESKMSQYNVAVEFNESSNPGVAMERAYHAHQAGGSASQVLAAMSTAKELSALPKARAKEAVAQKISMPKEVYNEKT